MNELRIFSLDEANRLIPRLNALLTQLQKKRDEISLHEVEVDAVELVTKTDDSGNSPVLERKLAAYQSGIGEFYDLVHQIHEMGCVLKDVDHGLIDFYTRYEDRIVYLCWRQGESEIKHWHDIGSGFSQRQPIQQHF